MRLAVREPEPLEQLVGAVLRRLAPEVVEPPHHHEVLAAGQVLVDGRVLAGEADLGTQRGCVVHDVVARDTGGATVGR